jgi:DNA-binding NarL/FixJ family response regulator
MLKILIADDHPIFREGLKQILSETTDMIVIDEASEGKEALDKARRLDCDMVLLDLTLPIMNGLEVLKHLSRLKPDLPVLVLSIHPEEQYALRALKAGASGYLTKESAPDDLISAIQVVSTGQKYVSPYLADRLVRGLHIDIRKAPHECLTDREYQVMRLIGTGKRISDIADELSLSTKTVSTYRARILNKMDMKSNAEIVRYLLLNQLLD